MKNRKFPVFALNVVVVAVLMTLVISDKSFALRLKPAEKIPSATVYWNKERQTIEGFGISEAFHQANNIKNFPDASKNKILDLLFSTTKGAGLSIVRNIVGDGGTWGNTIDGPTPTIEPKEGTWNWQGDEDQIWFMNQAKNYGCSTFVSSVWSPPAWMKTNNSVTGGGMLREDKYQAYADYLANYCIEYKAKFGIDIYAISLQNEPDLETAYSSCKWSSTQFNKFIKENLTPTFDKDGIKTKVMLGESSGFTESPAIETLNDPDASKRIDIVAAHAYNNAVIPFPISKSKGKSIWETEVSNMNYNDSSMSDGLMWVKMIHDQMTITEINAWLYWWGACYKTDGESLINMDLDKKTYSLNKRLYAIGNFSRFVRPGYNRIDATANPAQGLFLTAYKNKASGAFSIVVINTSSKDKSLTLNFNGLKTKTLTPYRTSESENLAKLTVIKLSTGSTTLKLSPKSVTTYVGVAQ